MLQQRQHILFSYFKTLSVGPAGFEPATSRSADRRLSNWANRAAAAQIIPFFDNKSSVPQCEVVSLLNTTLHLV